MATKQHSDSKKSRNRIQSSSKRSDWAAYMNGADLDWMDTDDSKTLAQQFDGYFPAWLIESEPWRKITGGRFRSCRVTLLGLTVEQCAAYLGIRPSTVNRWERGTAQVPKSAFETLRLLHLTAAQRITHKAWDGWFINRQSGKLVCPDIGKLEVGPEEVKAIPMLHQHLSIFKISMEQQDQRIAELEAENVALRSSAKSRQIAEELESMQERIAALLDSVRTAEIIEFNRPEAELRRA